jgi:hypothetical protein
MPMYSWQQFFELLLPVHPEYTSACSEDHLCK